MEIMDYKSALKEKIYHSLRKLPRKRVAVSFSGGVDSSVIAKMCKDIGKDVELYTVSFDSESDIKTAKKAANELGLPIIYLSVGLDELECTLKKVLSMISYRKLAGLNTSIGFYHVMEMVAKNNVDLLISANGSDELFCGYNRYKELYPDNDEIKKYMLEILRIANHDMNQVRIIGKKFGVEYKVPLLDDDVVSFSMDIPLKLKIKSRKDELRKHILRDIARDIGLSEEISMKPKKAFQYSSGVMKGIRKLAKRNGFTKNSEMAKGFESELEAYIEHLKDELRKQGELIV